MTFTFPVVGLVINLSLGIMIGTSTAVARAIGQGKAAAASRLTTHACILAILSVLLVAALGLLTQDFIFRALGAEGEVLALTKEYDHLVFGVVFLMVPLIANGALRASGDADPHAGHDARSHRQCIFGPPLHLRLGCRSCDGLKGRCLRHAHRTNCRHVLCFWVLLKKRICSSSVPKPLNVLSNR